MGRDSDESGFSLLAQTVPVESHYGSITLEPNMLRAPIAVTHDPTANRSHARARGCRELVDVLCAAARGIEIEQLTVRARPERVGACRCEEARGQRGNRRRGSQVLDDRMERAGQGASYKRLVAVSY